MRQCERGRPAAVHCPGVRPCKRGEPAAVPYPGVRPRKRGRPAHALLACAAGLRRHLIPCERGEPAAVPYPGVRPCKRGRPAAVPYPGLRRPATCCLRRKADGTGSEKSFRSDISKRMKPRDWTPKAGRAQSLAHQLAMVHGERCTVATPHGGFPAACGIQNCFARRACTKR